MIIARVALGNGLMPVGRLVFKTDGRRSHPSFLYDQDWIDNPRGFDALALGCLGVKLIVSRDTHFNERLPNGSSAGAVATARPV